MKTLSSISSLVLISRHDRGTHDVSFDLNIESSKYNQNNVITPFHLHMGYILWCFLLTFWLKWGDIDEVANVKFWNLFKQWKIIDGFMDTRLIFGIDFSYGWWIMDYVLLWLVNLSFIGIFGHSSTLDTFWLFDNDFYGYGWMDDFPHFLIWWFLVNSWI